MHRVLVTDDPSPVAASGGPAWLYQARRPGFVPASLKKRDNRGFSQVKHLGLVAPRFEVFPLSLARLRPSLFSPSEKTVRKKGAFAENGKEQRREEKKKVRGSDLRTSRIVVSRVILRTRRHRISQYRNSVAEVKFSNRFARRKSQWQRPSNKV